MVYINYKIVFISLFIVAKVKKVKNSIKIIASIEDNRKFRLNLYQARVEEDPLYLNVGDVVWLNLSER